MAEIKKALVTGGSSGIGQGIAIVLAEHGYDVAITYSKNEEGARATEKQIAALGRRCLVLEAHLEDKDTPQRIVDAAHEAFGTLGLVVNNAGRDRRHSILTATYEDMRFITDTNFFGYCLVAGAAARHMVRDGVAGNIIFITSTRGQSAHPDDFIYGGIKASIDRACRSMAMELSQYGIRVNCVAPGATKVRDFPPPDLKAGDVVRGKPFYPLSDAVPLGRMGTPRDNGELIAFLASDKASYITGETIRVDGGLTLPGQPEGYAPSYWINKEWARSHYDKMMEEEQ